MGLQITFVSKVDYNGHVIYFVLKLISCLDLDNVSSMSCYLFFCDQLNAKA